jgi:hypothetical protein
MLVIVTMWHAYPYSHGKVKLSKDLKTAEAHLRASLIDQEEIENMQQVPSSPWQIYHQRKQYYRIDSQAYTAPASLEEPSQHENNAHLSYKEKVDLYRRRLQSEKLESKYQSLFKKTEKRRHKMRNPVLFKMLEQFEEDYKHDDSLNIAEDLKECERNLEMIKINDKRRAQFAQTATDPLQASRPRFISLESSLPEKEATLLPKWVDYLQGRTTKPDTSVRTLNITFLENTFDSIIGQAPKTRPRKLSKEAQSPIRPASPQRPPESPSAREERAEESTFVCDRCQEGEKKREGREETALHQNFFAGRKLEKRTVSKHSRGRRAAKGEENLEVNAERTFTKSEHYSKEVIHTMSNFYDTKHGKRDDFKKMVHFLKSDRPLTSDIRRRNYKVITQDNVQEIRNYRVQSEMERVRLKKSNLAFYYELLKLLDGHDVQDLRLSGQILERTRTVLESHYSIAKHQLEYITEPCLYLSPDALSETVIQRIRHFISQTH